MQANDNLPIISKSSEAKGMDRPVTSYVADLVWDARFNDQLVVNATGTTVLEENALNQSLNEAIDKFITDFNDTFKLNMTRDALSFSAGKPIKVSVPLSVASLGEENLSATLEIDLSPIKAEDSKENTTHAHMKFIPSQALDKTLAEVTKTRAAAENPRSITIGAFVPDLAGLTGEFQLALSFLSDLPDTGRDLTNIFSKIIVNSIDGIVRKITERVGPIKLEADSGAPLVHQLILATGLTAKEISIFTQLNIDQEKHLVLSMTLGALKSDIAEGLPLHIPTREVDPGLSLEVIRQIDNEKAALRKECAEQLQALGVPVLGGDPILAAQERIQSFKVLGRQLASLYARLENVEERGGKDPNSIGELNEQIDAVTDQRKKLGDMNFFESILQKTQDLDMLTKLHTGGSKALFEEIYLARVPPKKAPPNTPSLLSRIASIFSPGTGKGATAAAIPSNQVQRAQAPAPVAAESKSRGQAPVSSALPKRTIIKVDPKDPTFARYKSKLPKPKMITKTEIVRALEKLNAAATQKPPIRLSPEQFQARTKLEQTLKQIERQEHQAEVKKIENQLREEQNILSVLAAPFKWLFAMAKLAFMSEPVNVSIGGNRKKKAEAAAKTAKAIPPSASASSAATVVSSQPPATTSADSKVASQPLSAASAGAVEPTRDRTSDTSINTALNAARPVTPAPAEEPEPSRPATPVNGVASQRDSLLTNAPAVAAVDELAATPRPTLQPGITPAIPIPGNKLSLNDKQPLGKPAAQTTSTAPGTKIEGTEAPQQTPTTGRRPSRG